MKINNLPKDFHKYNYITVREVNGEAWFYDGWDNLEDAEEQAYEFDNGHVVQGALAKRDNP